MSYKEVTKHKIKKFIDVYEYKDRTIAIYRAENIEQLFGEWEKAQLELAANYQYEDNLSKIWDYYLILICTFKDDESDSSWKFRIESDRFCCRKLIFFEHEKHKTNIGNLISRIFPEINLTSNIELLSFEEFTRQLGNKEGSSFQHSFLAGELEEEEINNFIDLALKG